MPKSHPSEAPHDGVRDFGFSEPVDLHAKVSGPCIAPCDTLAAGSECVARRIDVRTSKLPRYGPRCERFQSGHNKSLWTAPLLPLMNIFQNVSSGKWAAVKPVRPGRCGIVYLVDSVSRITDRILHNWFHPIPTPSVMEG